MSCVMRVSGASFEVDDFVAKATLSPDKVWHIGEKRGLGKDLSVHKDSGFNLVVSKADFHQFEIQQKDTIAFLRSMTAKLGQLAAIRGIDISLDFAVAQEDIPGKFYQLSPELIALASQYKMGIALSIYQTES